MSCLGPAQGRPHPVDHDAYGAVRPVVSRELDQPAGQPGQPDRVGAAHDDHLVGRRRAPPGSSCCAPPGRRRTAGSCSRQNPVSTTTWPWPRATSSRWSTTPARTSTQRSARGRPVTTLSRWSSERCTEPNRSGSCPVADQPGRRRAGPETSSTIAELLGDRAAVGVGVDEDGAPAAGRARPPGRPPASYGPGAPAGPHTADHPARARGRRRRLVGEVARATVGSGSSPAATTSPSCVSSSSATRARTPIRVARSAAASRSGPAGGTATGRTPWPRRWSTASRSRPGRVERHHGHVGLARGGGREQVADVDAALEDDHVGAVGEPGQGRRLPGRTGGQHQHDDHGQLPDHGHDRRLERREQLEPAVGLVLLDREHELAHAGELVGGRRVDHRDRLERRRRRSRRQRAVSRT